jgi:hypothetical protein
MDASGPCAPGSFAATMRYLVRQRSAVHLLIGGSVATFWSWGLVWWTPTFLQRSHHLSLGSAGELLGPMHLLAGTASTVAASVLMGGRRAADPRYVARLLAVVVLISTVPSILAYATHSLRSATVQLWLFIPGVYFFIGPIFGLLQNVVPAQMRATTCAMLVFLANIANLVLAPQLVGWLSDGFRALGAGDESLRWALLLLAPTGVWAAWHLWTSGRTIRTDELRATGSLGTDAAAGATDLPTSA